MRRPRIAIAGFQHETNTFAPFATHWEDFVKADAWPGLTRGAAIREVFAGLNILISGFMAAGRDRDLAPPGKPVGWSGAMMLVPSIIRP